MVQRAAAHEGERRDLDRLPFQQPLRLVKTKQIEQCVVQRPQVRVHFLREIARQEPKALARFYRGPGQHNAFDDVALQCIDRGGDRKIGLSGPRGPDTNRNVVRQDGFDLVALAWCAAA